MSEWNKITACADYIKKLTELSEVNQVTIIRVPGHSGVQ